MYYYCYEVFLDANDAVSQRFKLHCQKMTRNAGTSFQLFSEGEKVLETKNFPQKSEFRSEKILCFPQKISDDFFLAINPNFSLWVNNLSVFLHNTDVY